MGRGPGICVRLSAQRLPLSRGHRARKSSTYDNRDAVAVGCSGRVSRRPRAFVRQLRSPDGNEITF